MMRADVLVRTLKDQKRALLWWSLGVVLMVAMTVLFYPSVRDSQASLNDAIDQMPKSVRAMFIGEGVDMASPTGYLDSQFFSLMAPLLFIIYAIGYGARALAGEEESGTLDMLLANPVSRRRIVVEKGFGLPVALMFLAIVFVASILICGMAVGMSVDVGALSSATLSSLLMGLVFGAGAMAVGAARGRRGASIGAAAAVVALMYFINSLALVSSIVKPFRFVSFFFYYGGVSPMSHGFDAGDTLVLVASAAVCFVATLMFFERRDLRA